MEYVPARIQIYSFIMGNAFPVAQQTIHPKIVFAFQVSATVNVKIALLIKLTVVHANLLTIYGKANVLQYVLYSIISNHKFVLMQCYSFQVELIKFLFIYSIIKFNLK